MIMSNNLLYSSCKAKRLERRNFFLSEMLAHLLTWLIFTKNTIEELTEICNFRDLVFFFSKCSRGSEIKPIAY